MTYDDIKVLEKRLRGFYAAWGEENDCRIAGALRDLREDHERMATYVDQLASQGFATAKVIRDSLKVKP